MPQEQSISIYFPIIKENNTTKISSDLILLSKEMPNNSSDYFSFNIKTFKFKKIDNLMGYLIDNNIHSLTPGTSNQKVIENIGIALKKHDDPESNSDFELLTKPVEKRTLQN